MHIKNARRIIVESLEGRRKPTAHDIEYNMDETDRDILQYLQSRHSWFTEDMYELVMDRLEKEHHFLQRIAITKISDGDDLSEECNICGGKETEDDNFLVFCDGCNIAVHQSCYGVPHIPEGSWLCRPCLLSPKKVISCILCSSLGGAYKRTRNGFWCHVICGLLIPGARFENVSLVEPVDIDDVHRSQHHCTECGFKKGGVANCAYYGCRRYYHATCAVESQKYIDIANGILFCTEHDPKKKAELAMTRSPDSNYPVLENPPVLHNYVPLWQPQRRVHLEIENVPVKISDYVVNRIAERDLPNIKSSASCIKDMFAAWQARKKDRTIIKRLRIDSPSDEFNHWGKRVFTENPAIARESNILHAILKLPEEIVLPAAEKYLYNICAVTTHRIVNSYKLAENIADTTSKHILDMESNRISLISKFIKGYNQIQSLHNALTAADRHSLFKEQITDDIAPGYSSIIRTPVSLDLIKQRISKLKYKSFADTVKDVELLINNAYTYNGRDSFIGIETAHIEEKLRQYTVKENEIILARILPNPYMPYKVIRTDLEAILDAVEVQEILTKETHLIERDRLIIVDSSENIMERLCELNRLTGISLSQEKEQTNSVKAAGNFK
ncbi:bromodomain and PHD finger-containing protein 1 [Nematocida parisii]|nr:bromodomain and PHD finger-containing protein 1 [Nematocida parisii]KAI5128911.1 bromodomain and PHD finger-containing protein 1 [Nematocida parisii]KAI5141560.1 bromodomain and PHD finger-containing protein 1 [Nematocida parisii]